MKVGRLSVLAFTAFLLTTAFDGVVAPVGIAFHPAQKSESLPSPYSENFWWSSNFLFAPQISSIIVYTATSSYDCALATQKPLNGTVIPPRKPFVVFWTLRNTGARVWLAHAVDLTYLQGRRLYKSGSVFDLPRNVGPGAKIDMQVDMITPRRSGSYTTIWGLKMGKMVICSFYMTVNVQ